MQPFAIDGGAINGDSEVWIDASSASVACQMSGVLTNGYSIVGVAQVHAEAALSLSFRASLSGLAQVHVEANGALMYGVAIAGASQVQNLLSGSMYRRGMIQGSAQAHVELVGDIVAVPALSAIFNVALQGAMDLRVSTGQMLAGITPIVFSSNMTARAAKSARIEGVIPVQVVTAGTPALRITSPPGAAQVRLLASANDVRYGGRVDLEGTAELSLFAAADLKVLHYTYASGLAKIGILAQAESHGMPAIPVTYIEAPAIRLLKLGEESRQFIVPAERRA